MKKLHHFLQALLLFIKTLVRPMLRPAIQHKIAADTKRRVDFYKTFISPGSLVFDVGANLGNRVRPLLQCGAKVVAIEPQQLCYYYLRFCFGRQIEYEKAGLGAYEHEAEIMLNKESSTIASMSKDWIENMQRGRFKHTSWKGSEKIRVKTLDRLISRYGAPEFIKIDVEGFELEVLKGLSTAVPLVSFEYTTPEMTTQLYACIKRMAALSPLYKFNYAIGEQDRFELQEWLSADTFIELAKNDIDVLKGFGDIYARLY